MKRLLMATALASVFAGPAMAANTALTLWNDSNPAGAETAISTDTAILSGSSLGGITIQTSGAQAVHHAEQLADRKQLFVTNTTGTVQTLDIIAGANGYPWPEQCVQCERHDPDWNGAGRVDRHVLCVDD